MSSTPINYWQLGEHVMRLCAQASSQVMAYYQSDDTYVHHKADASPVTAADHRSHDLLVTGLKALLPACPVLSEESEPPPFSERRHWHRYWLVDPLDGTREFINRSGEFSINVALIEEGRAVLGVIAAPVENSVYLGVPGIGAVRCRHGESQSIAIAGVSPAQIRLLMGHRRINSTFSDCLARLQHSFAGVGVGRLGSALKFCRLAEGRADICAGLFPCYEWDIAAGQALLAAAGGAMVDTDFNPVQFNQRESLLSPHFFAFGDMTVDWRGILLPVSAS